MLDGDTFAGGAAKEIQEETGLVVPESELISLTDLALPPPAEQETLQTAIYPSAGGCDEYIPIFYWHKRIPRSQLAEWQGKLTGLREHGEKITLMLTRLEELWRHGGRDAKALAAYSFYKGLKKEGKI
jgi:ADP-sugar diphosphatase